MAAAGPHKFVLDTNWFVDASRSDDEAAALAEFSAWAAPGLYLSTVVLREVHRSFVFDILIAGSCREIGATLVPRNSADLSRIAKVFSFDFVAPYPIQGR